MAQRPSPPSTAETDRIAEAEGLVRSPFMIGAGCFLLLASGALGLVLVAGDRSPLWLIGAWFLLALAISLVVAGIVPLSPRPGPGAYDRGNGVDPAITGEPREEQATSIDHASARDPQ